MENVFDNNHRLNIEDAKSNLLYNVNLEKFDSVFSIVVTLERFGSLQTDLRLFLQKESEVNYPWSVYVADISIFLLTLKQHSRNPHGKFFEFLKARAMLYSRVYAIDELDMSVNYLKDQLSLSLKLGSILC